MVRQQDAGLFERLSQRRNPEGDATPLDPDLVRRLVVGQARDGRVGHLGGIVGVDGATGIHPHVSHEDRPGIALEHEHVRVVLVRQDHDGGRVSYRNRRGVEVAVCPWRFGTDRGTPLRLFTHARHQRISARSASLRPVLVRHA